MVWRLLQMSSSVDLLIINADIINYYYYKLVRVLAGWDTGFDVLMNHFLNVFY